MSAQLIVPSTGGSAPSGTGFVRTTGGAFVDPAQPLGATETLAAIAASGGTAAQVVRGNGTVGAVPAASFAGISLSKTADQSISTNTLTDVTWTNEVIAETSQLAHSTSSSPAEITINTAGKYHISGGLTHHCTSASAIYGQCWLYLVVNGTTVARVLHFVYGTAATPTDQTVLDFDWLRSFAANDVVKIQIKSISDSIDLLGQSSGVDQCTLAVIFEGA